MVDTLVWLWCMWCVRREYKRLRFNNRTIFLYNLRPTVELDDGCGPLQLEHPHAIFYVKPKDVKRALDTYPFGVL